MVITVFCYRAFRHTERNIADTGLSLLLDICLSFEASDFATQFYQAYHLQLLQEVFAVMTGEAANPSRAAASRRSVFNVFDVAWELGWPSLLTRHC